MHPAPLTASKSRLLPVMTGSNRPRVCKNALTSSSWNIDLCWLSDRTVNAVGRIGRDLEHVTLILQPLGWAQTSLFLCRQRLY